MKISTNRVKSKSRECPSFSTKAIIIICSFRKSIIRQTSVAQTCNQMYDFSFDRAVMILVIVVCVFQGAAEMHYSHPNCGGQLHFSSQRSIINEQECTLPIVKGRSTVQVVYPIFYCTDTRTTYFMTRRICPRQPKIIH